jgi:hypothetical protein
MESQHLEIERMRQEALEQKVQELEHNLERTKSERQEALPPSPPQKHPKKTPPAKAPRQQAQTAPTADVAHVTSSVEANPCPNPRVSSLTGECRSFTVAALG